MLTPEDMTAPNSSAVATIEQAIDEQRATDRDRHQVPMRLTVMGRATSLSCVSENISEEGCFAHLPKDCGLSVGQRCEIEFSQAPGDAAAHLAPGDAVARLAGEVRYATVVRTSSINPAMPHGTPPLTGAGMRFDQPLYY